MKLLVLFEVAGRQESCDLNYFPSQFFYAQIGLHRKQISWSSLQLGLQICSGESFDREDGIYFYPHLEILLIWKFNLQELSLNSEFHFVQFPEIDPFSLFFLNYLH